MRSIAPAFRTRTNLVDLFSDFDQLLSPRQPPQTFNFDSDLMETESLFILSFDVPGMTDEDINIEVEKGLLVVSGERERKMDSEDSKAIFRERKFGKFKRTFRLPDSIDAEQILANYDNGVLTINMTKKEKQKPRKIAVLRAPKDTKES